MISGQKVWTSYSDDADWCLLLARTDQDVDGPRRDLGLCPVDAAARNRTAAPADGQRDHEGVRRGAPPGARAPAANMIGEPGEGWGIGDDRRGHGATGGARLCGPLRKMVKDLGAVRRIRPRYGRTRSEASGGRWSRARCCAPPRPPAVVRPADGVEHGPEGSVDKLLMTGVEQAVGHAAPASAAGRGRGDDTWLQAYLYGRAQSVMGGTSQIQQRNLVARRILGPAHVPVSTGGNRIGAAGLNFEDQCYRPPVRDGAGRRTTTRKASR